MNVEMQYPSLEAYLQRVLANGRYTISFKELKESFSISEKALLQSIFRLKEKGRLAQLRKGFYVIVTPQYSSQGMLPPSLLIDDLMTYLDRKYYVALYSAAALHGAGHQQPMVFQVITEKPALRAIVRQKLNLQFYTSSGWHDDNLVQLKTETGFINVSSLSLTAFDLVNYHKSIGGLNRALPIIDELASQLKKAELSKACQYQKIASIQRLGLILEELEYLELSEVLFKKIQSLNLRTVPLSLAHNKEGVIKNSKWNVLINNKLDIK